MARGGLQAYLYADAWTFALYNIDTAEYHELPELGSHNGVSYSAYIEGQLYVMVPNAAFTTTKVIRVAADGSSTQTLLVPGRLTNLAKVR